MSQTRRSFLGQWVRLSGAAAVLGSGLHPLTVAAEQPEDKDRGLIWYSKQYVTAETRLDRLTTWITPTESFFIRNNLLMPSIDFDGWRLQVTGEVEHPLELTFRDLQGLIFADVTNTLECAGNGRAFFDPAINGVRWGRGGVGNATFSGPRLRDVLQKAGLKSGAHHVAFKGMDIVPPGANEFIRSIPLDKALDPNTLVALRMNNAPLTPEHGYPARALVPGWIGSCSIKWLTEIRVLAEEFRGFYMNPAYRLPAATPNRSTKTITSLHVKSIITSVAAANVHGPAASTSPGLNSGIPEYSFRRSEIIRIEGAAWAGESTIAKVEVSTDSGHAWHSAVLAHERSQYAWRFWSYDWKPRRPGTYLFQARATDSRGSVQPIKPAWNASGYMWNGVDQVRVRIEA